MDTKLNKLLTQVDDMEEMLDDETSKDQISEDE